MNTFVDLTYLRVDPHEIAAYAVSDIPATPASEECFAIFVYLKHYTQPITVTYKTKEDRDLAFDTLNLATGE